MDPRSIEKPVSAGALAEGSLGRVPFVSLCASSFKGAPFSRVFVRSTYDGRWLGVASDGIRL